MQRQRMWRSLTRIAALTSAVLLAAPGWAGDEVAPPRVGLQDLLRVPAGVTGETRQVRRGGHTAAEWRARFDSAESDRVAAEASLEASRTELEGIAQDTSQWKVGAPGGLGALDAATNPGDVPLNYRLHQEIRRHREDLARSERRLQELEIQASLAGVPEDWRRREDADDGDSSAAGD